MVGCNKFRCLFGKRNIFKKINYLIKQYIWHFNGGAQQQSGAVKRMSLATCLHYKAAVSAGRLPHPRVHTDMGALDRLTQDPQLGASSRNALERSCYEAFRTVLLHLSLPFQQGHVYHQGDR